MNSDLYHELRKQAHQLEFCNKIYSHLQIVREGTQFQRNICNNGLETLPRASLICVMMSGTQGSVWGRWVRAEHDTTPGVALGVDLDTVGTFAG